MPNALARSLGPPTSPIKIMQTNARPAGVSFKRLADGSIAVWSHFSGIDDTIAIIHDPSDTPRVELLAPIGPNASETILQWWSEEQSNG